MDWYYLVAAGLGVFAGISLTVIFLNNRIVRLDKNVRTSEELLKECRAKQLEIDRVLFGLHRSEILRNTEGKYIQDWDIAKFRTLSDIPVGEVVIARTDDILDFIIKNK